MKKLTAAFFATILLALAPSAWAQGVSISNLPLGTTPLTGAEISPLVQSSTTVKVPASAFANMPTVAYIGLTFKGLFVTSAGLPTIASGACGAAANGAVVAGSTNQSGAITIGAAATTTCTIVFSAVLGAAPKNCIIQPQNAAAAAVGTTIAYISSITTAHFVITGTALANANYGYTCL